MMICPRCHSVMKHVFRFTPDKSCELNICKNCCFETRPKKLKFDNIEIIQNNTNHNVSKKMNAKSERVRLSRTPSTINF